MYRLREERLRSLHSPEPSPLPKGILFAASTSYLVDTEKLEKERGLFIVKYNSLSS